MKNGVAQLVPPAHPIFHTVRSAMTNFTSPPAREPGSPEPGIPVSEPGGPGAGSPEPGLPASSSRALGSRLTMMALGSRLMMIMALAPRLMIVMMEPAPSLSASSSLFLFLRPPQRSQY